MALELEEKTKVLIMSGLAVVLVASLFINWQGYSARRELEREKNELLSENETLNKRITEAFKENKELQEKIKNLNGDLDRVSRAKDDLEKRKEEIQKQYELILKERDELQEKLKAAPSAKASAAPSAKEETYWAGIVKSKEDLSLQVEEQQQALKQLKAANDELRRELEGITREKEDLAQRLTYNQKTFDNITSQLVIEKNSKFQIQDELKPVRSENAALRRKLKTLNAQKLKLEGQLRELTGEKDELQRRFDEIQLFLQERVAHSRDSGLKRQEILSEKEPPAAVKEAPLKKEAIELPPIVVRPQGEAAGRSPVSASQPKVPSSWLEKGKSVYLGGSVVEINKENDFVVINLGKNVGVNIGDTFQVYRGGKPIASLEVIQVRENVAACDTTEENEAIKVGDTVR